MVDTMQNPDVVLQNYTLKMYRIFLTKVTPIHLIKFFKIFAFCSEDLRFLHSFKKCLVRALIYMVRIQQ